MTREEAIEILTRYKEESEEDYYVKRAKALTMAIKALEQEPRKGYWIDTNYHQYYNDGDIETTELRCSCCNEEVEWDIELLHKPYYCENCGADMKEVEE